MSISLSTLRRKGRVPPPIMVAYGTHGVGKTTFAAGAPNPVLLRIENGLGELDVANWPITSFAEVMQAIGVLYSEEHEYKTLIVDSCDWLEPLVWAETCTRNGWATIEQPDFGKGYVAADKVWREYLEGITALRDERNMTIIQLAHEAIVNFKSPDTEPFDRHTIKLHRRGSALVQENADIIGYIGYRVSVLKAGNDPKRQVTRGVGGGQRVLHLEERPAFVAKSRLSVPTAIDLPNSQDPVTLWQAFAQHLPSIYPTTLSNAA